MINKEDCYSGSSGNAQFDQMFMHFNGMNGVNDDLVAMMPGTRWTHTNPVAFKDESDEDGEKSELEELSESEEEKE